MNKCPNCGMSEDKVRSKRINREAYYCGTDKVGLAVTGRISVACAEIRRLQSLNAELLAALKKLTNSTTLSCTKHYADMRIDRDHLKEAGTAIAKAEVSDE